MSDIYFEPNYGKLYEKAEGGKALCWRYEGPEGVVEHRFILREIPLAMEDGPWFDLVTPYGYGGPVISRLAEGYEKGDLVRAFEDAFARYCAGHRVVSEFVRFHPLEQNARDFEPVYHGTCIRHTVGTNLKDYEDPVSAEFTGECRKRVRQALNRGVTWRVTPKPERIDAFPAIYRSTLERNHASAYYDFGDDYFSNCLKWFRDNLLFVEALLEGETIAAGLYFTYGKRIHTHLSGTLSQYLHLSPAYVLRYGAALWGKEHGYEMIHHGGGRTDSPEDGLYRFKKQFGRNTEFEFRVGRRIWNREVYDRLCRAGGVGGDEEFFPAYRRRP